ncbi:CYTH domain-containing protein [Xanthobacter dioxanivorans]|uniref:CYTH domain-containing protein n=1 Tax=Xanthobacter dioxanivorans TaxID=2528964 RepID=A0A974SLS9_9HYPH|nr:CYTH domain-containing protein [Xanthobacter dioxanivorans]QRG08873.1 CYTH domain-containing protein [Xanthobacter dioxanivorans]
MPLEIERKFLVTSGAWREGADACSIRQGYLCLGVDTTVRIRIAGAEAFITVKSKTEGLSRAEFEYSIPLGDAEMMLETLCARPLIEKTRYTAEHAGKVWTIDVFAGENDGLVVAEVELNGPDEIVSLPDWVGEEVTYDPRYRNSALVNAPLGNGS